MRLLSASPLVLVFALACAPPAAAPVDEGEPVHASCAYENAFSKAPECRDYLGAWSSEVAQADCDEWKGTLTPGTRCDDAIILGRCLLTQDGGDVRITFPGENPADCGSSKTGCEFFAKGTFVPGEACEGR